MSEPAGTPGGTANFDAPLPQPVGIGVTAVGEHRALLRAAKCQRSVAVLYLERAEHPELHVGERIRAAPSWEGGGPAHPGGTARALIR